MENAVGITQTTDPVIKQYREQISDNDLKILDAVNKRLKLVRKLKEYKESRGISFYDPAQESWILTYLSRSNRGPLSDEGLKELYSLVLEITKRELGN